jgi:hypothetical protein
MPQISRHENPAAIRTLNEDGCGAKNMARGMKGHPDARSDLTRGAELKRFDPFAHAINFSHIEQHPHAIFRCRAFAIEPLLESGRCAKHDRQEFRSRRRSDHRPFESEPRQHRKSAAVVCMGVSDDNGIEPFRVLDWDCGVGSLSLGRALDESNVDSEKPPA